MKGKDIPVNVRAALAAKLFAKEWREAAAMPKGTDESNKKIWTLLDRIDSFLEDPEMLMREIIAAKLFPDEWEEASAFKDREGRNLQRARIRDRAETVIKDAARITNQTVHPLTLEATPKPENVEIATEKDAAGLLKLIQESDRELAIVTRNYDKVRDVIGLAVDRTPLVDADGAQVFRPVFGVITADGAVEAACGLFPTQPWDSQEFYLRGFFLYVSNASRRSTHAKSLLQFSNWFGDRTAMTVVWEVLNCRALDERSRLFSRHAMPFGGFFIHRPVEKVAA